MSDSEIKQSFHNFRIGVVTGDSVFARILVKAIEVRGGESFLFSDGFELERFLQSDQPPLSGVIVTGNIEEGGILWIMKEFGESEEIDIGVIWFVGDHPVDGADGHTKRPFRPVELLRPFHRAILQRSQIQAV